MSRLPTLEPDALTPEQQRVVADITAGPRGEVRGPFVPLLHNPKATDAIQRMGAFLRFDGTLPGDIREMVILIVARHWDAQYEWFAHHHIALEEGRDAEGAEAFRRNETPSFAKPVLEQVHAFVIELHRDHAVSDATYAAVLEALGPAQTVELVVLCGHYNTIAMVLNGFAVEVPGGERPLG